MGLENREEGVFISQIRQKISQIGAFLANYGLKQSGLKRDRLDATSDENELPEIGLNRLQHCQLSAEKRNDISQKWSVAG